MAKEISFEEFCAFTKTKPYSWIFEGMGPNAKFTMDKDNETTEVAVFDDGNGTFRRFKDMPEYGEIWMCVNYASGWSLYNTWTVY